MADFKVDLQATQGCAAWTPGKHTARYYCETPVSAVVRLDYSDESEGPARERPDNDLVRLCYVHALALQSWPVYVGVDTIEDAPKKKRSAPYDDPSMVTNWVSLETAKDAADYTIRGKWGSISERILKMKTDLETCCHCKAAVGEVLEGEEDGNPRWLSTVVCSHPDSLVTWLLCADCAHERLWPPIVDVPMVVRSGDEVVGMRDEIAKRLGTADGYIAEAQIMVLNWVLGRS